MAECRGDAVLSRRLNPDRHFRTAHSVSPVPSRRFISLLRPGIRQLFQNTARYRHYDCCTLSVTNVSVSTAFDGPEL